MGCQNYDLELITATSCLPICSDYSIAHINVAVLQVPHDALKVLHQLLCTHLMMSTGQTISASHIKTELWILFYTSKSPFLLFLKRVLLSFLLRME